MHYEGPLMREYIYKYIHSNKEQYSLACLTQALIRRVKRHSLRPEVATIMLQRVWNIMFILKLTLQRSKATQGRRLVNVMRNEYNDEYYQGKKNS